MSAFILITATVSFALAVIVAGVVVVSLVALLMHLYALSPYDRVIRERRRHAERTARAMQRMTEIRRQTAERMDRAEERSWS